MAKKIDQAEGDLRLLEGEFRAWRRGRRRGERIPPGLWAGAVSAARVHGLWRTARRLGLDYVALKRRCEAPLEEAPAERAPGSVAAGFVEIPWPADRGPECQLELEDGRGARLRVSLRGAGLERLETATKLLWGLVR